MITVKLTRDEDGQYFKFTVSDNQAYKQLGNSVSVPVIERIAQNMIMAYNN